MNLSIAQRLQIFIPFALGFFISYLFRVINAVIAPNLVADVGMDAAQLGLLTAAYFITFAAIQLPLGVLLDRFGSRRMEAGLLMVGALGAVVFANAHSVGGLVIGRGLIGLGVSACLMGAFKAYVSWFPMQQLPLINGFQMAAGGLGAMAASAPVEAMLSFTDWRGVFLFLALFTALVAAVIYFIVPDCKIETSPNETLKQQFSGIGQVLKSRTFWRITPWATVFQATYLAVHTLWAGPWMRDVAGFDRGGIAATLMLMAVFMVAGYIIIGAAAERLSRRGVAPMTVAGSCMVIFLVCFLVLTFQFSYGVIGIWLLFSFFGTSGIITYAALSQHFPRQLAGRVNTVLNLFVFVVAFLLQWGIGAVLNRYPVTDTGNYAPAGYRTAFLVLVALQILSLIWYGLVGRDDDA